MIGILTYHFAHNYGAMLQAYAHVTYYRNIGLSAEIINYYPDELKKQYSISIKTLTAKNFVWKFINNLRRRRQYDLFEKFKRERLTNTQEYNKTNIKDVIRKYDSIVVGSDQVWNTQINHEDPNYFLDFVNLPTKKLGYSISIGPIKISSFMKEYLDKNLASFDRISFREKSAADYIFQIYHKKFPITVDPVFLLNCNDWRMIEKRPRKLSHNYFILCYLLSDDLSFEQNIMELSKNENLPIVAIHPLCKRVTFADENLTDVGPEQFLWLLNNAVYVASNSFHATAFSIIFRKKALLKPHPILGNRNKDLLSMVNISSHNSNIKYLFDFSLADTSTLDEKITYSKIYLKNTS